MKRGLALIVFVFLLGATGFAQSFSTHGYDVIMDAAESSDARLAMLETHDIDFSISKITESQPKKYRYEIRTIKSQLIRKGYSYSTMDIDQLDLSDLKTGDYELTMYIGELTKTFKFKVQ